MASVWMFMVRNRSHGVGILLHPFLVETTLSFSRTSPFIPTRPCTDSSRILWTDASKSLRADPFWYDPRTRDYGHKQRAWFLADIAIPRHPIKKCLIENGCGNSYAALPNELPLTGASLEYSFYHRYARMFIAISPTIF